MQLTPSITIIQEFKESDQFYQQVSLEKHRYLMFISFFVIYFVIINIPKTKKMRIHEFSIWVLCIIAVFFSIFIKYVFKSNSSQLEKSIYLYKQFVESATFDSIENVNDYYTYLCLYNLFFLILVVIHYTLKF